MNWFKKKEVKSEQFETVLKRLVAAQTGTLSSITPDNCMRSPTVHAIVTAVSRRIAVSPLHVYRKGISKGRETKEKLPDHPIAKLLKKPNDYQSRYDYWQDAASAFIRHGAYMAWIGRGTTGPIRTLHPLIPSEVTVKQDDNFNVTFTRGGTEYPSSKIHYVRSQSRDFFSPNSPIKDVQMAIALEIAAEEFGATFFNNGAVPLMILQFAAGSNGFKTDEEQKTFIEDFQAAFSGNKRHKAMILPKGIEKGGELKIENNKAQFLETRKYQRTVIAGAFGVPPHLAGDLERATFNNVEQQDSDFTLNVIMPIVQAFEAGMEKDLLTDEDRSDGIVIRFNLDVTLRADFKTRQEGYQLQIANGMIAPDDAREKEGMNPRLDGLGGEYLISANLMMAKQKAEETNEEEPETNDESLNDKT